MHFERLKKLLSTVEPSIWAVVIVALLSFTLFRYSDQSWRDNVQKTAPPHHNVAQAKAYLAKGYLFFERRMAGDETIRVEDVFQLFVQAIQAIDDIMKGRSTITGIRAIPPTDPELLNRLEQFHVSAKQFRDLAQERWENREAQDTWGALEQRSAFYEVERMASDVDYLIDQSIRVTMVRQRQIYALSLALWMVALIGVCLLLFLGSRRRKRAEAALQSAYGELEQRVGERTAELIKANASLKAEIAVRKRAEEELEKEKEFTEAALNAQKDTFFVFDSTNGQAIRWNRVFTEVSGYSDKEIAAMKAPDDWYSEKDLQKAAAATREIFRAGHTTFEMSLITKSGKTILTEYSAAMIQDDEGHPRYIIAIGRDIAERKQTEETLKKSELRFRSLIEQTTDAVFCYEYDPPIPMDLPIEEQVRSLYGGVLAECNDVCARSYGATRAEEVVGKTLTDLFGTAPGSLDGLFTAMIQGDYQIVDGEGVEVLEDETKRYYLNNGHGVVEGGKLVRVWGTFRDITESKRAEEALRESEKQYREQQAFLESIYNNVDSAIFVVDVTPDGDFRYADNNQAHQRNSGLRGEGFVGQRPEDLIPRIPPQVAAAVRANYQRCLDLGQAIEYDEKITVSGRDIWSLTHLTPLRDERGQIHRIVGISADITERVQTEERLKASLREKETLLRELYHRTRNNMQVICAMLQLQATHSKDRDISSAFNDMENRIQSMALVHEELYQSQNLSQINLKEYIHNLSGLLVQSQRETSGRIAFTLDTDDVFVLIDTAIPCGLILNELVSNALKHAFPGDRRGEIRIRLDRAEDGPISLEVSDDGVGMPKDLDLRTSETLGLKIVFGLGERQLRGEVTVGTGNEMTGHGTTWQIRFRDDLYAPRV
jgi:PAS domain S-box-containing protein